MHRCYNPAITAAVRIPTLQPAGCTEQVLIMIRLELRVLFRLVDVGRTTGAASWHR
jgi:hypothetical protein